MEGLVAGMQARGIALDLLRLETPGARMPVLLAGSSAEAGERSPPESGGTAAR